MNNKNDRKYKIYDLNFKTLSPVHIGDGNKMFSNSDYVYDDKKIYYIDKEKLNNELYKNLVLEEADKLIEEHIKLIKNLNGKNHTLKKFIGEKELDFKDYILEEVNCDEEISEEINCFIKTNNRCYIPGSSLKGSIRTAILYKVIKDNEEYKKALKYFLDENSNINLKEDKSRKKDKLKAAIRSYDERQLIINDKPNIDKVSQKLETYIFGDILEDLLKNVQVADSNLKDEIDIKVLKTYIYNFSKREKQVPIVYETVGANQSFRTRLKLVDSFNNEEGLLKKYICNDLSQGLFRTINEYSLDFVKNEIKFLESNKSEGIEHILSFYKKLEKKIEEYSKTNKNAIIRLGKGKSYYNSSIGLLLSNKMKGVLLKDYKADNGNKEETRNLDIDSKIIDKSLRRYTDNNKVKEVLFPRTRVYEYMKNSAKSSLGWVEIKFDEVETVCR